MSRVVVTLSALVGVLSLSSGCRGQLSSDPPVQPLRNMLRQQRYNPQSDSPFFANRSSMRDPVAHTVPREHYEADDRIARGRNNEDTEYVLTVPEEIPQHFLGMLRVRDANATIDNARNAMMERGQDRYNIYCAPCHGRNGNGHGIVVERARTTGRYRWTVQPPSFIDGDECAVQRLRRMPDGQVFATISNGKGTMPAYSSQLQDVYDRWAIVAYVRALQLSQQSVQLTPNPRGCGAPTAQPTQPQAATEPTPAAQPTPAANPTPATEPVPAPAPAPNAAVVPSIPPGLVPTAPAPAANPGETTPAQPPPSAPAPAPAAQPQPAQAPQEGARP